MISRIQKILPFIWVASLLLALSFELFSLQSLFLEQRYTTWTDRDLFRAVFEGFQWNGAELTGGGRTPGPIYYLVLKSLTILSGDPQFVFAAMLCGIVLATLWLSLVASKVMGPIPALFLGVLLLTTRFPMGQMNQVWNPSFSFLFILLAYGAALRILSKNSHSGVWLGLALAAATQCHISSLWLLPAFAIGIRFTRRDLSRPFWIGLFAAFALPFLPSLIHDLTQGFSNLRSWLIDGAPVFAVYPRRAMSPFFPWQTLFGIESLSLRSGFSLALFAFGISCFFRKSWPSKHHRIALGFSVVLFIGSVVLFLIREQFLARYALAIYPALALFLALAFSSLFTRRFSHLLLSLTALTLFQGQFLRGDFVRSPSPEANTATLKTTFQTLASQNQLSAYQLQNQVVYVRKSEYGYSTLLPLGNAFSYLFRRYGTRDGNHTQCLLAVFDKEVSKELPLQILPQKPNRSKVLERTDHYTLIGYNATEGSCYHNAANPFVNSPTGKEDFQRSFSVSVESQRVQIRPYEITLNLLQKKGRLFVEVDSDQLRGIDGINDWRINGMTLQFKNNSRKFEYTIFPFEIGGPFRLTPWRSKGFRVPKGQYEVQAKLDLSRPTYIPLGQVALPLTSPQPELAIH